MAHFIAFDENVEVKGDAILSIIDAMHYGKFDRRKILANNGIVDPEKGKWYSQVSYLNGYKEIGEKLGDGMLYRIGTVMPQNAVFPPDIDSVEKALNAINMAYHMNHRNGDIGYYKVLACDENERTATMECKNPYHSVFDKGLISAMVIKFMPSDSVSFDVVLDPNKETRLEGADSCTFNISW